MSYGLDDGLQLKTCRPFFLIKKRVTNLSKSRTESTDNVLAKLSEKRLRLFRHDFALDVYHMVLDYAREAMKEI